MTEKYTYYLNINSAGYYQVWPGDNQLIHTYKIEEEHEGHSTKELSGSFALTGSNYTALKNAYENNQSVLLQIFENGDIDTGTSVYIGFIEKFNEFDENESKVYCKDFITFDEYFVINAIIDSEKEYFIDIGIAYPIDYLYDGTITTKSYKMGNIIDSLIGTFDFDDTDCWYNNEGFELDKVRLANLKDLTWLEISENNTSQRKKITLKRIFEIIEFMFRGYWYLDGNSIKFKKPEDFVNVILDIPDELVNIQRKNYDDTKRVKTEVAKFNKNNNPDESYYNTLYDENTNVIEYTRNAKTVKTYDLQDITTLFNAAIAEYNLDGYFMAHVDNATNNVIATSGWENGALTPNYLCVNIMRDYMYTNNTDYSYAGYPAIAKPNHIRPFIELPEVTKSLDSIATFYEGIRFKNSDGNEIIGRVWEMSTNLFTNQTKFRSFEFTNTQI